MDKKVLIEEIKNRIQTIIDTKGYLDTPSHMTFIDEYDVTLFNIVPIFDNKGKNQVSWMICDLVGCKDKETLVFSVMNKGIQEFVDYKVDGLLDGSLRTIKEIQEINDFLEEQLYLPMKPDLIEQINSLMNDIKKTDIKSDNLQGRGINKIIQYRFDNPIDTGIEHTNSFGESAKLTGHIIGFNEDNELLVSQGRGNWIAPDYWKTPLCKISYKNLMKVKDYLLQNN